MIRLYYKLLYTKMLGKDLESFCKNCGRTVHDFSAPNYIWDQVQPHIKYGHVLCYDCFCEICYKLKLPCVWNLKEIKKENKNAK